MSRKVQVGFLLPLSLSIAAPVSCSDRMRRVQCMSLAAYRQRGAWCGGDTSSNSASPVKCYGYSAGSLIAPSRRVAVLRPILMLAPHVDVRDAREMETARLAIEFLTGPLLAAGAFVGNVHAVTPIRVSSPRM